MYCAAVFVLFILHRIINDIIRVLIHDMPHPLHLRATWLHLTGPVTGRCQTTRRWHQVHHRCQRSL